MDGYVYKRTDGRLYKMDKNCMNTWTIPLPGGRMAFLQTPPDQWTDEDVEAVRQFLALWGKLILPTKAVMLISDPPHTERPEEER